MCVHVTAVGSDSAMAVGFRLALGQTAPLVELNKASGNGELELMWCVAGVRTGMAWHGHVTVMIHPYAASHP